MSSSGSSSRPDLSKLEPLDGNNYKRWSQKVLIFFEQIEIDYVLLNDPPLPLVMGSLEETPQIIALVKKNEDDVVKYENDNKTTRYHIQNHMVDILFDLGSSRKRYRADDTGVVCYVCGKPGHKTYQCNSRPQKQAGPKTPQANLAESDDVISVVVVEENLVANANDWARDAEFFEHVFPLNKDVSNLPVVPNAHADLIDAHGHASCSTSIDQVVEPRKSKRSRIEKIFGGDFISNFLSEIQSFDLISDELLSAHIIEEDPNTYNEAIKSIDDNFWMKAIKNELDSIVSNQSWDLVDLPKGCGSASSVRLADGFGVDEPTRSLGICTSLSGLSSMCVLQVDMVRLSMGLCNLPHQNRWCEGDTMSSSNVNPSSDHSDSLGYAMDTLKNQEYYFSGRRDPEHQGWINQEEEEIADQSRNLPSAGGCKPSETATSSKAKEKQGVSSASSEGRSRGSLSPGWTSVYIEFFTYGVRFPFSLFTNELLIALNRDLGQICPLGWLCIIVFHVICKIIRVELNLPLFTHLYTVSHTGNFTSFSPANGWNIFMGDKPTEVAEGQWHAMWCFNKGSMDE
ncbi:hypothetical protein LIER_11109 [Lithospermum erythrorhizon]|uniref:CCHC-type domain-containing protein n=1 Tax=Lithospermum erythrorhizon TaxID=34254 RepID=A0AAV3PLQ5_LITER